MTEWNIKEYFYLKLAVEILTCCFRFFVSGWDEFLQISFMNACVTLLYSDDIYISADVGLRRRDCDAVRMTSFCAQSISASKCLTWWTVRSLIRCCELVSIKIAIPWLQKIKKNNILINKLSWSSAHEDCFAQLLVSDWTWKCAVDQKLKSFAKVEHFKHFKNK